MAGDPVSRALRAAVELRALGFEPLRVAVGDVSLEFIVRQPAAKTVNPSIHGEPDKSLAEEYLSAAAAAALQGQGQGAPVDDDEDVPAVRG